MSLPRMWRLSNPLWARMIAGLSLPLFFTGARESVLCRQQAPRDRGWRASSLQQMTSPCGLSAGFERPPRCWPVYWACLIKYENYFLRVWPGHWPNRMEVAYHPESGSRQAPLVPSLAYSVKLLRCMGGLRTLGEGWRHLRQWVGDGLWECVLCQLVCGISIFSN